MFCLFRCYLKNVIVFRKSPIDSKESLHRDDNASVSKRPERNKMEISVDEIVIVTTIVTTNKTYQ